MPLVDHVYKDQSDPYYPAITLAEAKQQLNITGSSDDDLLKSLIVAASKMCEQYTWGAFGVADWECWLAQFPDQFLLCKCPVNYISGITYYSTNGDTIGLVPGTDYIYDLNARPAVIKFLTKPNLNSGFIYPIKIAFNAGYPTVPDLIKRAVAMTVANLYEQRTDNIVAISSSMDIPITSKNLLFNERTRIY